MSNYSTPQISHVTTNVAGIKTAVKHTISVNGRNGGYVFSGRYSDPMNSQTRRYLAEIMQYIAANKLSHAA
jgi:hypothetical protein